MSRKAVTMSQEDFETLVLTWANGLTKQGDYQTFDSPQEEAESEREYGRMYVIDMYVHNALMECMEQENKVFKDITKIQVDFENCGCDINGDDPCGFWTTSAGIPTLGCYVGGDWEDPVFFVLYPETANTIRAYVPKDGNTWNIKTKIA